MSIEKIVYQLKLFFQKIVVLCRMWMGSWRRGTSKNYKTNCWSDYCFI